jgi:hypothetical protein
MEPVIKSVKEFHDQYTTSLLTINESTRVLTTHNPPRSQPESSHPHYQIENWPNEGHLHTGRQMVLRSHF